MWWPCLHKWPTLWPCGDPARLYCSPDDLLWFVHLATFWTATLTPGWPLSLERPKRSAITATRDFRFGLKLDYYWQEIIFVIIVLKIRFLFVLSHRAKNKIKTNIYKFKIRSIWCQLAPNWGRIWYPWRQSPFGMWISRKYDDGTKNIFQCLSLRRGCLIPHVNKGRWGYFLFLIGFELESFDWIGAKKYVLNNPQLYLLV